MPKLFLIHETDDNYPLLKLEVFVWPDHSIRTVPYIYVDDGKGSGYIPNSGRPVLDSSDYGDDVENWNMGEHAND